MILTEWKRLPGGRKQRTVYDGTVQRIRLLPTGYAWQVVFPNGRTLAGSVATEEQAEQAATLAWDAFAETSQEGMPV